MSRNRELAELLEALADAQDRLDKLYERVNNFCIARSDAPVDGFDVDPLTELARLIGGENPFERQGPGIDLGIEKFAKKHDPVGTYVPQLDDAFYDRPALMPATEFDQGDHRTFIRKVLGPPR